MTKIKVLNLYAGIGGNRKYWENVDVTAIENNKEIAQIYMDFFPNDKMIVTDAHKFLLEHYAEFDFIWSSPPCPTHSRIRKLHTYSPDGIKPPQNKAVYPDLKLYEEILFLQGYFKGKWVVENVISWYEPLIKPKVIQRHFFWCNFPVSKIDIPPDKINEMHDVKKRNMVNPELGLHIFEMAFKDRQKTL